LRLLPAAIGNSVTPMVAQRYGAGDFDAIRRIYLGVLRIMTLLVLPLCLGGCLLSAEIIRTLYGAAYAPATNPMRIAFLGSAPIALLGVLSAVLYGLGAPGTALRVGIVLTPVSIGLNVLLIHLFGITGAAMANIIVQSCAIPYTVWQVTKRVDVSWPLTTFAHAAIALGPMTAVVLATRHALPGAIPDLIVAPPLGALWYCGTLILLGEIRQSEMERVVGWFRRSAGAPLRSA
jgi:O-antigen/teichoic acid export membrane protein